MAPGVKLCPAANASPAERTIHAFNATTCAPADVPDGPPAKRQACPTRRASAELSRSHQLRERGPDIRRPGLPTHIAGLRSALAQERLDRIDDRLAGRCLTQMLQ